MPSLSVKKFDQPHL